MITEHWIEWLIVIFFGAVALNFAIELVATALLRKAKKTEGQRDDHLVPLLRMVVRFLAIAGAVTAILFVLGVNVLAPLAGLGVFGLVLAMAMRGVLENIVGAIVIYFRAPFMPGHHITMNSYEGVVQHTGLRDTEIKTSEGAIVSIPNRMFNNAVIRNNSLSQHRPLASNLYIMRSDLYMDHRAFGEDVRNTFMETLQGPEEFLSIPYKVTAIEVRNFNENGYQVAIRAVHRDKEVSFGATREQFHLRVAQGVHNGAKAKCLFYLGPPPQDIRALVINE